MIIFDSTDIASTARNFSAGYRALSAKGLPSPLYVQQLVINTPHGKVFAASFFWGSDDHETGQACLAKVAALGHAVMNTVGSNTLAEFLQMMKTAVPPNAYGSIETISIRDLTPEAIEIMARNIERMPSTNGTSFSMHELRGPSASPNADSVFGSREPHMMLEIITAVAERKDLKEAQEWAGSFIEEMRKTDGGNILPGTYISLTPPGSNSFRNIFGTSYEPLLDMKRKYDPEGTFRLALQDENI
jgi:hypothetical protein